jgi:hypothetical protein
MRRSFMKTGNKEVSENDNIVFQNEWWKRMYDILCNTEEVKEEFHHTYLKRDDISGSLLEYRRKVMEMRLSTIGDALKVAVGLKDMKRMKNLFEDMFIENVSEDDVEQYLKLLKDVDVDDFLQYVKSRIGVRFVYAMRHYKKV